jgi:hypothetical protein
MLPNTFVYYTNALFIDLQSCMHAGSSIMDIRGFLTGPKAPQAPGEPPAKKPARDRREYEAQYEKSQRSRKFDPKWERDRPWLTDSSKGMMCTGKLFRGIQMCFRLHCFMLLSFILHCSCRHGENFEGIANPKDWQYLPIPQSCRTIASPCLSFAHNVWRLLSVRKTGKTMDIVSPSMLFPVWDRQFRHVCFWLTDCIDYSKVFPPKRTLQFISGCSSYKSESVSIHEQSDYHKKALDYKSNITLPRGSKAQKALISINNEASDKLKKCSGQYMPSGKNSSPE